MEESVRKKRKWQKYELENLRELRRRGLPLKQIAKQLGRTLGSCRKAILSYNLPKTQFRILRDTAEWRKRVRRLVESGHTDAEIAKKIGVSRQSVGRFRRRCGLPEVDPNHPLRVARRQRAVRAWLRRDQLWSMAEAQSLVNSVKAARLGWPQAANASQARVLQAVYELDEPTKATLAMTLGHGTKRHGATWLASCLRALVKVGLLVRLGPDTKSCPTARGLRYALADGVLPAYQSRPIGRALIA